MPLYYVIFPAGTEGMYDFLCVSEDKNYLSWWQLTRFLERRYCLRWSGPLERCEENSYELYMKNDNNVKEGGILLSQPHPAALLLFLLLHTSPPVGLLTHIRNSKGLRMRFGEEEQYNYVLPERGMRRNTQVAGPLGPLRWVGSSQMAIYKWM